MNIDGSLIISICNCLKHIKENGDVEDKKLFISQVGNNSINFCEITDIIRQYIYSDSNNDLEFKKKMSVLRNSDLPDKLNILDKIVRKYKPKIIKKPKPTKESVTSKEVQRLREFIRKK